MTYKRTTRTERRLLDMLDAKYVHVSVPVGPLPGQAAKGLAGWGRVPKGQGRTYVKPKEMK